MDKCLSQSFLKVWQASYSLPPSSSNVPKWLNNKVNFTSFFLQSTFIDNKLLKVETPTSTKPTSFILEKTTTKKLKYNHVQNFLFSCENVVLLDFPSERPSTRRKWNGKKALSRLFFTSFVSRPFEKKRNFYRDKRKKSFDEKFSSSSYFLIFVVLKQWRGCKNILFTTSYFWCNGNY